MKIFINRAYRLWLGLTAMLSAGLFGWYFKAVAQMASNSATTLYNPIQTSDSLTDLLLKIMQGFLTIIGAWAMAFIVIGGFKLVMSQGDEEAVTKAKKSITWAVLGLVVALLAFSIIAIIQNLLGINIHNVNTSYFNIAHQQLAVDSYRSRKLIL